MHLIVSNAGLLVLAAFPAYWNSAHFDLHAAHGQRCRSDMDKEPGSVWSDSVSCSAETLLTFRTQCWISMTEDLNADQLQTTQERCKSSSRKTPICKLGARYVWPRILSLSQTILFPMCPRCSSGTMYHKEDDCESAPKTGIWNRCIPVNR